MTTMEQIEAKYFPHGIGGGYSQLQIESACNRIAELETENLSLRKEINSKNLAILSVAQTLVDLSKT